MAARNRPSFVPLVRRPYSADGDVPCLGYILRLLLRADRYKASSRSACSATCTETEISAWSCHDDQPCNCTCTMRPLNLHVRALRLVAALASRRVRAGHAAAIRAKFAVAAGQAVPVRPRDQPVAAAAAADEGSPSTPTIRA